MEGARTRLRLRVMPGARRSGIVERRGNAWKVRVAAAPENGKANDALLELLAKTLGVPRRSVELTTGAASRDKVVAVSGLSEPEIDRRLAQAVGARHAPRAGAKGP